MPVLLDRSPWGMPVTLARLLLSGLLYRAATALLAAARYTDPVPNRLPGVVPAGYAQGRADLALVHREGARAWRRGRIEPLSVDPTPSEAEK